MTTTREFSERAATELTIPIGREDRDKVPGVSAAVVADGRVRCIGSAGVRNRCTGEAMTPATRQLWFSMTKIATATAAMRLVDAGRLDIDVPVVDIVPGIVRVPRAREIRVRHLLQHTSGLPDPVPVRWVRPATTSAPDARAFLRQRLDRVHHLRCAPGRRASYSNLGYLLLGEVIAGVTGQPFSAALRDLVLTPLGMDATSFDLDGSDPIAVGYQRLPRGGGPLLRAALPRGIVGRRCGRFVAFEPFLVHGAAYGGLVGPVTDAARLLLLHAASGAVDGERLLDERTARRMLVIDAPGTRFDHGLGWFRGRSERTRRPPIVEHYGSGAGYFALMRLVPAEGVGVVVMGNSTSFGISALADSLLRDHGVDRRP